MQFLLLTVSFGALIWLHVTSDFSVLNVVENSHTDKPLLYKISGVWGNHEGSMMLWTFILGLYGFAVSVFGRDLPPGLRARALSVQGMIGVAFILFILLTSNPFVRIDPAPLNGNGLNPLLQDPGLAFHPPFLYLGYVGFSMAFSFAVAALIEGHVDAAWARWVRPWTLVAWCALTLGIAMGSWWSYYTLGWGGYWAWDPVENASFMPWLAGTALLHSCIVAEKRDTMKSWTILLAIITFSLSLLGTFLVRSGVLTSVHSFASDPARGVFIVSLLALFTGGSLILYAVRAPALKGGGLFTAVSREGSLLFNNVMLGTAAGTVLIGTLYPLFVDALGLGKISVGPPYFNTVMVPLMVPLVLLMAVGPLLSWKRGDLAGALSRLKFSLMAAVLAVVATLVMAGTGSRDIWAAGGLGLAVWLLAGSITEWAGRVHLFRSSLADSFHRALHLPRSTYGMTLGHIGLALMLIGIAGSQAWRTEFLQVMHPGDTASVAGYRVHFIGVENGVAGANYTASRARFVATRDGRYVTELRPERRMYDNPRQPLSTVAIHTNFLNDLYAVLGDPDGTGDGFVVHIFHNPLVPLLFFGALVMVLGGIVSLTDRRHRIGAPLRKLAPRPAPAAAAPAVAAFQAGVAVEKRKSWNFALPFFGFAALVGVLLYRLYLVEQGFVPSLIPSVMIGRPMPGFRLDPLLEGGLPVSSASIKGKVAVVSFFASWCGPCREEHPLLSQIPKSVDLVGISYKDRPEDSRDWLGQLGNPYTAIGVDLHGQTGLNFGVYGVPETYVIDKTGLIRFKQTGPLTPEVVKDRLLPLLARLQR
jgi:cytochrome c-type biogenesis protein CcmF